MKWNGKLLVAVVLDGLHLLALAVWLGGLATLWLAVMPAAFHTSGLTMREAEAVVGDSLRNFTGLVEVCGIAMAGAQFVLRRRYQSVRALFVADGIRQLLTFGALMLAEVNLRVLLPQMDTARQQAHVADFHHLHQNYAVLATLQAMILLVVGALTAWLQSPRQVAATPNVTPTAAPNVLPTVPTPLAANSSQSQKPNRNGGRRARNAGR